LPTEDRPRFDDIRPEPSVSVVVLGVTLAADVMILYQSVVQQFSRSASFISSSLTAFHKKEQLFEDWKRESEAFATPSGGRRGDGKNCKTLVVV